MYLLTLIKESQNTSLFLTLYLERKTSSGYNQTDMSLRVQNYMTYKIYIYTRCYEKIKYLAFDVRHKNAFFSFVTLCFSTITQAQDTGNNRT